MDVLRGAFWYNIWIGIGFFFSFIVSLGITDFSGSQIYVSCAGTVNPVVSRHRSPFTFVRSAGRGRTSCGSVITHYDTFILRLQSIVGSPRGCGSCREPPWLACAIHTANQVCPASLLLQAILPPHGSGKSAGFSRTIHLKICGFFDGDSGATPKSTLCRKCNKCRKLQFHAAGFTIIFTSAGLPTD